MQIRLVIYIALAGCTCASSAEQEMVMPADSIITVSPLRHKQALHPESGDIPFSGKLEIRAGSGYTRSYTWDGETRSVDLLPRDERWYGSLGAYYPGPGSHWRSNHGITRGVLEEGRMHFDTLEEAQRWLAARPLAVYSHDGTVVEFSKNRGAGGTLSVNVWQVLVGQTGTLSLKGSRDDLLSFRIRPNP